MKKKFIVLAGPTASGKSGLAKELAKEFCGEIISADSMQIYKGLDIGTAKVKGQEMGGIAHHLIDIIEVDSTYNTALYQRAARGLIEEIINRGKMPIISGGTGLYINSVLFDMNFSKGLAQDRSNELNKPYYQTGEYIFLSLNPDRGQLYQRIDKRVDDMLELGLEQEVRGLLASGISFEAQGMRSIGYKEWKDYFEGKATYADTVRLIKQYTRNYAKRQITWFKRYDNIKWLNNFGEFAVDEAVEYIKSIL